MILVLSIFLTLFLGASDLISFESLSHDFGSHPKTDNTLVHDFSFTNVSGKPVSLSYAVATCSCTKVSWTQETIKPGDKGTVHVTYRREANASSFEKFVSVFVAGQSKPVVLRITGSFYDTEDVLSGDFPVRMGPAGAPRQVFDLGTVAVGSVHTGRFQLANLSEGDFELSLADVSEGLVFSPSSSLLYSKSRGSFRYTARFDSAPYGLVKYYATPVIGDSRFEPLVFKAVVTDDFSSLTQEEVNAAPYPRLVEKSCSFGTVPRGKDAKAVFSIRNSSDKPINVRAVYSEVEGTIFAAPSKIAPGQTARFEVTVPSQALGQGKIAVPVGVVCDSPITPVVRLTVTGKVE